MFLLDKLIPSKGIYLSIGSYNKKSKENIKTVKLDYKATLFFYIFLIQRTIRNCIAKTIKN